MTSKAHGPVPTSDCRLVQLATAVGVAHLPLVRPALEAAGVSKGETSSVTVDELFAYFEAIDILAPSIEQRVVDQVTTRHWYDRWYRFNGALTYVHNMIVGGMGPSFDGVWFALSAVFYEFSVNDPGRLDMRISDWSAMRAIKSATLAGVDYSNAARVVGIAADEWPLFVTFVADANRATTFDPVRRALECIPLVTAPRH